VGKTALITGGAGFIGSNLASTLLADGWKVSILDNLLSGYSSNIPTSATFIHADVRHLASVEGASKGVDAIFHLAASVGNKRSIDNPLTDAEINVLGTLHVLEAARRNSVPKVVISSSAGIFGELKTLPIREDHPVEPDTPYGASKLCAEKQGLAYSKLYPIDVVCLRYFNVFGPHQRFDAYGNVIPIFVFQMLRGEALSIYGDGEQTRDFVHVSDVVQANIRAAGVQGLSGAFNIGSGTRMTINRLVELLRRVSGLNPMVRYAPPRPGDVRDSLADISAARAAFAYAPSTEPEAGLSGYFEWASAEVAS
jgi:UDP-glucose 4-epimerase